MEKIPDAYQGHNLRLAGVNHLRYGKSLTMPLRYEKSLTNPAWALSTFETLDSKGVLIAKHFSVSGQKTYMLNIRYLLYCIYCTVLYFIILISLYILQYEYSYAG